jgi:hypothetical protein
MLKDTAQACLNFIPEAFTKNGDLGYLMEHRIWQRNSSHLIASLLLLLSDDVDYDCGDLAPTCCCRHIRYCLKVVDANLENLGVHKVLVDVDQHVQLLWTHGGRKAVSSHLQVVAEFVAQGRVDLLAHRIPKHLPWFGSYNPTGMKIGSNQGHLGLCDSISSIQIVAVHQVQHCVLMLDHCFVVQPLVKQAVPQDHGENGVVPVGVHGQIRVVVLVLAALQREQAVP